MKTAKANISLDEETKKIMDALPRQVKLSAMVRVMIAGLGFSTEKEFAKYLKDNPEAARAKEYMKQYFKRIMSK